MAKKVIFDDENEPRRSIKEVNLPNREVLKKKMEEETEQISHTPKRTTKNTHEIEEIQEETTSEEIAPPITPPRPRKRVVSKTISNNDITPAGGDQGIRVSKQTNVVSSQETSTHEAVSPLQSILGSQFNAQIHDDIRVEPVQTSKQYGDSFDVPQKYEPRRGKGLIFTWIALVAVLFVAIYIFFIQGSSAEVQISVQPIQSTVNESLTGVGSSTVSISATGIAPYPAASESSSSTSGAPVMVKTQTKATGVVVLYNSAKTPQSLVINTRVQTSKGLVYRINNKVTIPAQTVANGQDVPGSIEVQATADQPGESYNTLQTDGVLNLTLPGLKGSPQFDTTFAKTKGVFQGGFNGMRAKVGKAEIENAKAAALSNLKKTIYDQAKAKAGAQNIVINSSIDINPSYVEGTSSVTALATATVIEYVRTDLEKIVGFPISNTNNATIIKKDDGSFELTGQVEVQADVDQTKLKTALSGIKKTDAEAILRQFPSIKDGSITIKPFWKQSLPTASSNITITVK